MPDNTTINFQSEIGAGADGTLRYEFSRSGRVTRIFTVAVLGEEADVERTWFVDRDHDRQNVLLSELGGTLDGVGYLAGDDTTWDLSVDQPFTDGDVLELEIVNNDANNSYPNIAFVEVSFGEDAGLVALIRRGL